ncbi:MAG: hypothetical protein IT453_01835 [Planctomycetes bacterium]|nr:hypothetical protein [Planctomycetota bacterium]
MLRSSSLVGVALFVAALLAPVSAAQSNSVPGMDVSLSNLGAVKNWGRIGAFPNGTSAMSMSTTACNVGTVNVGWNAPMNTNHPVISFLVCREENGRFEQISDRSYVKHGFYATNQGGCASCSNPSGNPNTLFVGCSDTYGTDNNADRYYLGAASEIDPWLGNWTAKCSLFDKGEPAVAPPFDCDGVRSLNTTMVNAMDVLEHRINLTDADLDHPAATFYYQGFYTVRGEPEANRGNNAAIREMNVSWSGTKWNLTAAGAQFSGSILDRWSGATIGSNTNGVDDGRLFVGVKVTGPFAGLWHYEYAVYNRDNARAVGAFHLPVAVGATVSNVTFRDIDTNTGNDWQVTQLANELVFTTALNPIEWGTLYNFSFDSSAGPVAGSADLNPFHPGTGAGVVPVGTVVPLDVCAQPTVYCTAKVNSLGCTPSISLSTFPSASQGSGCTLSATNVIGNKNGLFFHGSVSAAAAPFHGGYLCVASPLIRHTVQNSGGTPGQCDGVLSEDFNAYIAGVFDPLLGPGVQVWLQGWSRDPGDPFTDSLTDAVTATICP